MDAHETPMDPRRPRYFVVAAEEQNIARAAVGSRIAQPPFSAQIKQLERDIGAKLFDRKSRGVRPYEAGRLVLEEARRVFARLDQTVDSVRRVGDGRIGRLALGFLPSAAHRVLPSAPRKFRERFPDVELSLQETGPDEGVRKLHDKRIDAVLSYPPVDETGPDVGPVGRRLAGGAPVGRRDAGGDAPAGRRVLVLPPR